MRRLHLITPLLLGFAFAMPAPAAHAQIGIGLSITIAPPILPVYVQPAIPAPGYIWTPGYWAYGADGYYWVPGTWVQPPQVGVLWTPGYWGWNNGAYAWNGGYWGPHIGFYGGVNYGYGYTGSGYEGGRWNNGQFAYNRSVNNFGTVHVTNVYNRTVINNNTTRVAYNGGTGGVTARPTAQEEAVAHEQHVAPTPLQVQHVQTAASNPELRASVNHGQPVIAATSRPNEFTGKGVVAARPVVTPTAAGAPLHPGGAPGPAITRPEGAPALRAPATFTEHPGTVTAPPGAVTAHPGTVTAPPGTVAAHPGTVTERPGTVTAPSGTGTVHPETVTAHPAAVTPGTQIQHPVTAGVQHPAPINQPHPSTAPTVQHVATPAYHPAPAQPAYHPAAASPHAAPPAYHPAAAASHAAPPAAPHPAPQKEEHHP